MSQSSVPFVAETGLFAPVARQGSRLRAVEVAFCALILALPLETVLYYQSDANNPRSSVSIAQAVGLLLLALALVDWKWCFRKIPAAFWLFGCYLTLFTLTQLTIPAAAFPEFYERQHTLIQTFGLFLLSFNLLRQPEFRRKALGFYGWLMTLSALGMITGVFGVDMAYNSEDRHSLLAQDANLTAGMFAMALLCLLAHPRLLEGRRRLGRIVLTAAAAVILVFAILRTGSRGGLLVLGGGLLAFGACPGRGTRAVRACILLAALAVSGGLIAQEFARGTATSQRLQRAWEDNETAGRDEIFAAAWQMFQERPLLGWGGGANRYILGARLDYPDRDTHNIFLATLTEVGLVGALPFFFALADIARRSWRAGRLSGDVMLFPLVVALLVMCTSITGMQAKIFWIVLGAGAAGDP